MLPKAEIIMPLHNLNTKEKMELLIQSISMLRTADAPVVALCDSTIKPIELPINAHETKLFDPYQILQEHPNLTIRENQPLGEWEKVKQAYDESKAQYIGICHQDDFWKAYKFRLQIRTLKEHRAPLCMSAYDMVTYSQNPAQFAQTIIAIPVLNTAYGCLNVMPSMWVFDKAVCKEWTIPYKAITALDISICMQICDPLRNNVKIPVITTPLLTYNFHLQNTTHEKTYTTEWNDALVKCHEYTKDILSPKFQYLNLDLISCFQETLEERKAWLQEYKDRRVRFQADIHL